MHHCSIDVSHVESTFGKRLPVEAAGITPQLAKAIFIESGSNMSATAKIAGYPRTTFRKLLKMAGGNGTEAHKPPPLPS
ncbi:hypothetical protein [Pajaroellobacter abortibovis]|nr:hypothetical protein [Pajaroellobacter abortibovis]